MATTLAPVDGREVVQCEHCQLVQFRKDNNSCKRCRRAFEEDKKKTEPASVLTVQPPIAPLDNNKHRLQLATSIRKFRQSLGLSQQQLAERLHVARSYISKVERERATPTLSSLNRLAAGLEVSVEYLLRGPNPSTEDEIADFAQNKFLSEIAAYLGQLDAKQRLMLLAEMSTLSAHTSQP